MIVRCDRCANRLARPGAVVLSPPVGRWWRRWHVRKYHVCAKCWPHVERAVTGRRKPRS